MNSNNVDTCIHANGHRVHTSDGDGAAAAAGEGIATAMNIETCKT